MKVRSCLPLVTAILCLSAGAAVEFDGAKNIIQVSDFTKETPLTLKKLQQLDKMNAWGKVKYDKETDTYTVEADLYVGKNDGTDTHMQIGTDENPREILVLRGNLVIYPFGFQGEKDKKKAINRLTIGDKNKEDIKPALKLGNNKSIFLGGCPTETWQVKSGSGGELYIYNSTVGGIGPNEMAGMNHFSGWNSVLEANNSVFVNFKEPVLFETHAYMTCNIGKCVFTDSVSAAINSTLTYKIKDSTFSKISRAAFYGYTGAVNAELTDCKFENNNMNFELPKGGAVKCIDCVIGSAAAPDLYGFGVNEKTKKEEPASLLSLRHLVVQAVDEGGAPVKDAVVTVTSESGVADSVYVGQSVTGADGLTPGKGDDKALLLTELKIEADKASKGKETKYSYAIQVKAGDKIGTVKGIKPSESWQKASVILKK